jgi:hypothetical protein
MKRWFIVALLLAGCAALPPEGQQGWRDCPPEALVVPSGVDARQAGGCR